MKRSLAALIVTTVGLVMPLNAQPDKPVSPATPAFKPAQATQPEAKAKPKVYDENADAKKQIADAVAKAAKDNKRVLIQWGGNWCGWCIMLHDLCAKDKDLSHELLYEYVVVHADAGRENKNMDLAKSYGADVAKQGFPYLTILDSAGKPIANQETSSFENKDQEHNKGHDAKLVLDFLKRYEATPVDAQQTLDAALAQAKKSDKIVFLHFGAPWCIWCHRMEDWMATPEITSTLDSAFVDLKVDVDRAKGGKAMIDKLTGGKEGGIPWFVFMDSSGKVLATSDGAKGNIGFPSAPEEITHFIDMIKKSGAKLSQAQIDALVASLNKTREAMKSAGSAH